MASVKKKAVAKKKAPAKSKKGVLMSKQKQKELLNMAPMSKLGAAAKKNTKKKKK